MSEESARGFRGSETRRRAPSARRRAFIGSLSAALAGCSLMLGEGYSGGSATDADTSAPESGLDDAGLADVAFDGESGLGPNVLPNGEFEQSGARCGGEWGGVSSVLTRVDDAHGGESSCRVCSAESSQYFTLDLDGLGVADVLRGEVFRAKAWVRSASGPVPTVRLIQRVYKGDSFEIHPSVGMTPSEEWKLISFTYEMPMDGKLDLYFEAKPSTGTECFIVDDIVLAREK